MAELRYIFHPGYDFGRGLPFVKNVHGFVLDKPSQIKAHLLASKTVSRASFASPVSIREVDLAAIHSKSVLLGIKRSKQIAAAAELAPLAYLPNAVTRHFIARPQVRACGGTQTALAHAANGDWVLHLSGGFHHARPGLSHGFCLVNDVAWAIHKMREAGTHKRILILDLDLHQGDGNVAFFAGDDEVFTASLHEEGAFPFPKLSGDLDRGLRGEVDDEVYLQALDELLDEVSERFAPEVVIYVAGTDPYCGDSIGSFAVSREGLRERDLRVARVVESHRAGLVVLPAGGYSSESPRLSADGFIAIASVFAER